MFRSYIAIAYCALLLNVVPLQAQRAVTSDTLDVQLYNPDCLKVPADVFVVVNGDDSHLIHNDTSAKCHWTFVDHERHFHAGEVFTLRLVGARSDCKKGEAGRDEKNRDIVRVVFKDYKYIPAHDVVITPSPLPPALSASYIRTLPRSDCKETGVIKDGGATAYDVRFNSEATVSEKLLVQVDVPNDAPLSFLVNDRAVIAHADKGGHKRLGRKAIAAAVRSQRLRLIPNVYDLDQKKLNAAGVRSFDLTVK